MTVAFVAKLIAKRFEALQKKLSILTQDHEADTMADDFLR